MVKNNKQLLVGMLIFWTILVLLNLYNFLSAEHVVMHYSSGAPMTFGASPNISANSSGSERFPQPAVSIHPVTRYWLVYDKLGSIVKIAGEAQQQGLSSEDQSHQNVTNTTSMPHSSVQEIRHGALQLALPDCGRNKTCLTHDLVDIASKLVLEKNKKLWDYLLHRTDYNYDIKSYINTSACETGENILIVYVHSHPEHYSNREIARKTWARNKYIRGVRIINIFGVGISKPTVNSAIEKEAELYRDIIRGSFKDAYHNMTLKHHMGLRWVYENCPQSSYWVKMDDDVILNVDRMVAMVTDVLPLMTEPRFVCSEVWRDARPFRSGKYQLTLEEYSAKEYPPLMCPGRAYVAPTPLVLRMVTLAPYVRFVWLDDVWATSVLGTIAGANYTPLSHATFKPELLAKTKQHCWFDMFDKSSPKTFAKSKFITNWETAMKKYRPWPEDGTSPC